MPHNIKIIYSKIPAKKFFHDSSGTNRLQLSEHNDYKKENVYELLFELSDIKVVKDFIEVWNASKEMVINFNTYTSLTAPEILEKQKIMNEVISKINAMRYDDWLIPDTLVLEYNGNDSQVDKLNALHRFFEDCSYDIMQKRILPDADKKFFDRLFELLEKVNYLVHRMEGGATNNSNDFLVFRNSASLLKGNLTLSDDDYNMFVPMTTSTSNGALFLDYSTVGKDLEQCYYTNDIELIQAKELKQQGYINPAFNFTFNEMPLPTEKDEAHTIRTIRNAKNQWCEENDVGDYYDYWLPKFNFGRIKLGKCIDEKITGTKEYRDMTNLYPYIVDVIVE